MQSIVAPCQGDTTPIQKHPLYRTHPWWSYRFRRGGTETSARRVVVVYFENQLELNESICDVDGIATVQLASYIAIAKSNNVQMWQE